MSKNYKKIDMWEDNGILYIKEWKRIYLIRIGIMVHIN